MRFLGIDYGTKRIGLALSDEAGQFAYPHVVLKNMAKTIEQIATICRGEKVGEIVIGWSLDYRRRENSLMKRVHNFRMELMRTTGLVVALEDEVLTTREADQEIGPDDFTDARAAAIILRTYLEHRNTHQ
ncbi:MAG TPA: Holliday junction resolvase RuvX [Candidatus Paceibacterota bacterium]